MENMCNKVKSEKGSVTLFVLVAMILLLVILLAVYTQTTNKNISQKKELEKIQEEYKGENIEQIYNESAETKDTLLIPDWFYTVEGAEENSGFVISDVQNDDLNNSKSGNQFMWIPV